MRFSIVSVLCFLSLTQLVEGNNRLRVLKGKKDGVKGKDDSKKDVTKGNGKKDKKKDDKKKGKKEGGMGSPLNIVLTNDDGFETEMIQSLFFALEGAGHNVIMSAPYGARSGTSAAIEFLVPLSTTSEDSPGGTIATGSAAIGETTLAENQYYVDGAVTSAVLYGIDVLAKSMFGGAPDLVISGPNEGNNVGILTPHSGTVGATVTAINRGIPAMAVSGDSDEENPDLVGEIVATLVETINGENGLALESFQGLNVNIPNTEGFSSTDDVEFVPSKVGISASVGIEFVENLAADCPFAAAFGLGGVELPGLCVTVPYTSSGYIDDTDEDSEYNVITAESTMLRVAVSPLQGTYSAMGKAGEEILENIENLF